jgi:glycosyltransferase involved in cell wall biosynthesis
VKILFLSGEFPPMQGGVGDYTREIGLALHDLGCQVLVATSPLAGPNPPLTVHPIIEKWNWSCWRTIFELLTEEQPDVVHIQYQAAAYDMHPAINLLPRRLQTLGDSRPRTTVTFHDLRVPYLFPKAGPVRRWVVKELAQRCDAAITTNREDWQSLERELGTKPALIPIGSNIAPVLPTGYDRDAWRARWGAGPNDPLIVFFGFINDRKGVDTLLHALRLLIQDPNFAKPRLLFIGGQTGASDPTNVKYLANIQALVAELEIEDRVDWTGYVDASEVSALFEAADMCALPFHDGVSFLHGTFHAALAHGVPVITTQPRVALPELENGSNVILVPAEDPRALAEAMARLAAQPDLRNTLGKGAFTLSQEFTWDKIAGDTLELYRAIGANG